MAKNIRIKMKKLFKAKTSTISACSQKGYKNARVKLVIIARYLLLVSNWTIKYISTTEIEENREETSPTFHAGVTAMGSFRKSMPSIVKSG